ncbi:hypothetical protein RRG08_066998 [Elysia crispata]|uniref:Uncharacterized protein n=1 Tax=Elysia crispata TaxID=231223 RepID=A0AAE1DCK1_9GAST|nr:hypothetical protein RRG08_066998 [Elysia crispata]
MFHKNRLSIWIGPPLNITVCDKSKRSRVNNPGVWETDSRCRPQNLLHKTVIEVPGKTSHLHTNHTIQGVTPYLSDVKRRTDSDPHVLLTATKEIQNEKYLTGIKAASHPVQILQKGFTSDTALRLGQSFQHFNPNPDKLYRSQFPPTANNDFRRRAYVTPIGGYAPNIKSRCKRQMTVERSTVVRLEGLRGRKITEELKWHTTQETDLLRWCRTPFASQNLIEKHNVNGDIRDKA